MNNDNNEPKRRPRLTKEKRDAFRVKVGRTPASGSVNPVDVLDLLDDLDAADEEITKWFGRAHDVAHELDEAREEIERLRKALQDIADYADDEGYRDDSQNDMAKRALGV